MQSPQNYLWQSVCFMLLFMLALTGLYHLPPFSIGKHEMEQVDLLSALRKPSGSPTTASLLPDTLSAQPIIKVDTVLTITGGDTVVSTTTTVLSIAPNETEVGEDGTVFITDYTADRHALAHFYTALRERKAGKRQKVRIAFFGDSFIEGDILTSDLRNLLQSEYGGCGVGFVPMMTSLGGEMNPNFQVQNKGEWRAHSIAEAKIVSPKNLGFSGSYYMASGSVESTWKCKKGYSAHAEYCEEAYLYLLAEKDFTVHATINGADTQEHEVEASSELTVIKETGTIRQIKWAIEDIPSSTIFWGGSMEGAEGVVLDNFSLRGVSGLTLSQIPASAIQALNAVHPYDLVILEYGLNVASPKQTDYSTYQRRMTRNIQRLQELMPQTSFLLIGVGDRNQKEAGEYRTIRGIHELRQAQQAIAANAGIGFWDLYTAMGGNGGMARMVNAKPRQANLDYTHINFKGGKVLAENLFRALEEGKKRYEP